MSGYGMASGNSAIDTVARASIAVLEGKEGSVAYAAKTANYTMINTDYQIECTANTFIISLPTSVGIAGKVYSIKNTGTGIITVDGNGAETIDGDVTHPLAQWENISIVQTVQIGL